VSVSAQARQAAVSAYDALGRRVAVLHGGPLAAGVHEFALDAASLAPGVYVVRATANTEAGAVVRSDRLTVAR